MISIQNGMLNLAAFAICVISFSLTISAQSTDLNFPTAVTTSEINGTIRARDIGDSRLTSFFYGFDGGQGDVFINVLTKNFSGDIDVFATDGLRPLTKIVIYADAGESETGRLIYLRKPERLILRVEGRSPNDDPATFRIKFAGSFIALAEQKQEGNPAIAKRQVDPESGIRVNSVGTIVEIIPKQQPSPKAKPEAKETVAANNKPKKTEIPKKKLDNLPTPAVTSVAKTPVEKKPKTPKRKENIPEAKEPPAKPVKVAKNDSASADQPIKREAPEVKTVFKKQSKSRAVKAPKPIAPPIESKPDPMASIRLVVQLKDGKVIERPMNEVTKFSVDKGVLTVTAIDGSTVKYSMLDVAKVTIE